MAPGPERGSTVWVRCVVLAALGATVGTLLDWAHVENGAVAYTRPVPLGIAWWTPVLYAGAALAIGISHSSVDRWIGRAGARRLSPLRLGSGMLCFLAIWYATGALRLTSALVAALLAPACLAVWWLFDATRGGLALALATALAGVGVEATLVRFGLFRHTHPDVLGVAWWLPTIYVAASVAVGNVGRALAGAR
jgi:hypothetical protein